MNRKLYITYILLQLLLYGVLVVNLYILLEEEMMNNALTWIQTLLIVASMVTSIFVVAITNRKANDKIGETLDKTKELATGSANSINQLATGSTNSINQLATGNSNSHLSLSKEHEKITNMQNEVKSNIAILVDRTSSSSQVSLTLQAVSNTISHYAKVHDDLLSERDQLLEKNLKLESKIRMLEREIKDKYRNHNLNKEKEYERDDR